MLYESECTGDLIFITVVPPEGVSREGGIIPAYEELAEYLSSHQAVLLHERAYGLVSIAKTVAKLRELILANTGKSTLSPFTFVEGKPCNEEVFAGIHVIAAIPSKNRSPILVEKNGHICGCQFQGEEAEYVFLSDVARLLPDSQRGNRYREAREVIKLAGEILQEINWSYKDVRRTWFYLDEMLDWYDDFNKARNELYEDMGLFNRDPQTIIPASTAI